MIQKLLSLAVIAGITFFTGCASVISNEVLQQVDSTISFESVFRNPEAYKGSTVLWGGVIIATKNLKEGTLLEILEKPLGYGKAPADGDKSGGRFLALYDGYLDAALYAKDREVTLAGTLSGRRVQRLDEIDYAYPYLIIQEIHLWEEQIRGAQPPPPLFYPFPYRYYDYWHYPFW